MKKAKKAKNQGFSLLELMISMTITLLLLGLVSSLFSTALGVRTRESRKTDALTAARAAINVISREAANSGYGLTTNGIVLPDSGEKKLHFRANLINDSAGTNSPGEDVTYYFDPSANSIVRFDPHALPTTSVVVNRISDVAFSYFNYTGGSSTPTETAAPTSNTGRIRITVKVRLEEVIGQPSGQTVTFSSDVTLRNSYYMLNQY